MDGDRFDQFTRVLAGDRTRRSTLKLLAGGIAAGVAGVFKTGDALGAVRCRKAQQVCRKDAECCSGDCSPLDRFGRGRCLCGTGADCPTPSSGCKSAICTNGICSEANACAGEQICYRKGCCTPAPKETICLNKCGTVTNNCGQSVDCGACCGSNGSSCSENADCCGVCIDGECSPASGFGERCDETEDCESGLTCCGETCQECCSTPNCSPYENECGSNVCSGGRCQTTYEENGTQTASQTSGDCKKNVCDGAGKIITVTDDLDVPDDENQCTSNVCSEGTGSHPPVNSGDECSQNDGSVCDGAGNCVECVQASDCLGTSTAIANCSTIICKADNTCGVEFAPEGTLVIDSSTLDCIKSVCDGAGNVISVSDDDDTPVPTGDCYTTYCNESSPVSDPKAAGELCSGGVCDGTGLCIECLDETSCGGGQSCCGGYCVDTDGNNDHCGTCDSPCSIDEICCNGNCANPNTSIEYCGNCTTSCSGSEACCDGYCHDLDSDVDYCGSCDVSCDSGQSCCGGFCNDASDDPDNCGGCGITCIGETSTCCGVDCVNTTDNDMYCGDCFTSCVSPSEVCCGTSCVVIDGDDVNNCGGCGVTCGDGQACCYGICTDLDQDTACGNCDLDCTSTGEYCVGAGRYCVTCVLDEHCSDGELCCAETCVFATDRETCGSCDNNCADSSQYCDGAGACIDCRDSDDCQIGHICCDNVCAFAEADETCGSCDNDCTVNSEFCTTQQQCVECTEDSHCAEACVNFVCCSMSTNNTTGDPCCDGYYEIIEGSISNCYQDS